MPQHSFKFQAPIYLFELKEWSESVFEPIWDGFNFSVRIRIWILGGVKWNLKNEMWRNVQHFSINYQIKLNKIKRLLKDYPILVVFELNSAS
jgi:NADH:ubiquinone oxidoreductase subunit D